LFRQKTNSVIFLFRNMSFVRLNLALILPLGFK